MSNKIEMPCNCSNKYCFDKVPEESIVRRDGEPKYVHLKTRRPLNITQTISWEEWIVLCDNCRTDDNGWRWVPYVPDKK